MAIDPLDQSNDIYLDGLLGSPTNFEGSELWSVMFSFLPENEADWAGNHSAWHEIKKMRGWRGEWMYGQATFFLPIPQNLGQHLYVTTLREILGHDFRLVIGNGILGHAISHYQHSFGSFEFDFNSQYSMPQCRKGSQGSSFGHNASCACWYHLDGILSNPTDFKWVSIVGTPLTNLFWAHKSFSQL